MHDNVWTGPAVLLLILGSTQTPQSCLHNLRKNNHAEACLATLCASSETGEFTTKNSAVHSVSDTATGPMIYIITPAFIVAFGCRFRDGKLVFAQFQKIYKGWCDLRELLYQTSFLRSAESLPRQPMAKMLHSFE